MDATPGRGGGGLLGPIAGRAVAARGGRARRAEAGLGRGQGPGQVLLANLAMWCADRGIGRLDLMLGREDYKLRLGCGTEPVRTWVLPRTVLGRAVNAAYRAAKGTRRGGAAATPRPGRGA